MEETNVVLPPTQEQPKSSKKVFVVLITIIALLVGGVYLFKQSGGSDNGEMSEIDRVVAVVVDIECNSFDAVVSKPVPKDSEGFDTSLKRPEENLEAMNEILKKYGFKDEMEFEAVGSKYRNTEEFANKVLSSAKYIECTNAVLNSRENSGPL